MNKVGWASRPVPRKLDIPRLREAQILLLLASSLCAQNAQLPRKGRKPDRTPPPPAAPIRKLPRKSAPAPSAAAPLPRPAIPAAPLSEDRLRPVLRGAPSALSSAAPDAPNPLPRPSALEPGLRADTAAVRAYPVRNRWYIFPAALSRRYDDRSLDAIYSVSRLWDPYHRNPVKGDFPIFGRRHFFVFSGLSETVADTRRLPVPTVASAAGSGDYGFWGRGEQFILLQNFRFSLDLFRGSAGFRPVDWEVRITPEFNLNRVLARENALLNSDVRRGIRRTDSNVGIQELFFEKRLFSERGHFDFSSLRLGIQRFTSDFRGFVFSDEQPGARLFGTFRNNVFQYNLAWFNLLEKDTNSGLNRWRHRQQSVSAANLYWSDFLTRGYTLNVSALYNHDQASFLIDKNGFLVRPAPVGLPVPHKVRALYAGISGDGHIGRINVSHAFYQAFGRDDQHPIAAAPQHIDARLAAAEFAYEKDWMTWKASALFATGDRDLNDGQANGFDAIVPNQQFAGGGFLGSSALADRGLINNAFSGGGTNFLNRQPLPLTGTGLLLFGPNSLLPSMRAGLFEGQANFINPGILLFNAGMDAKLTPKLRSTVNVNWAKFHRTEVLQAVLFQSHIRHAIGLDTGVGLQYRPLLSENIVVTGGFGTLFPGRGFKDLYTGRTLFSGFVNVRLLF